MDALTPTVLDTDRGIDDALALLLAWGSPELGEIGEEIHALPRRDNLCIDEVDTLHH